MGRPVLWVLGGENMKLPLYWPVLTEVPNSALICVLESRVTDCSVQIYKRSSQHRGSCWQEVEPMI